MILDPIAGHETVKTNHFCSLIPVWKLKKFSLLTGELPTARQKRLAKIIKNVNKFMARQPRLLKMDCNAKFANYLSLYL